MGELSRISLTHKFSCLEITQQLLACAHTYVKYRHINLYKYSTDRAVYVFILRDSRLSSSFIENDQQNISTG